MDSVAEYKLKLYKELLQKIVAFKSNIALLKKHNYTTAIAEYEYDILVCKNTLEFIRKTLVVPCDLVISEEFMEFLCFDRLLQVYPKGIFKVDGVTVNYNNKSMQPIELAAKVFDIPLELINFKTKNMQPSLADEMGCSNP